MNKKIYISAILAALIVFGGGYYLLRTPSTSSIQDTKDFAGGDIPLGALPAPEKTSAAQETISQPVSDWQTFVNASPAFSFKYPKQYTVAGFEENGGYTILIQGSHTTIFQIFVSPFQDARTLTAQDLADSLPDLSVRNAQSIQVLSGSGLSFISDNNLSVSTREIWFVRNGFMYQVSIPLEYEKIGRDILTTVKFK